MTRQEAATGPVATSYNPAGQAGQAGQAEQAP